MNQELAARALAETIAAQRAAARLSQQKAADKAGISRASYMRYEKGQRSPTVLDLVKIASAFGLSLGTFVKRVEDRMADIRREAAASDS